MYAVRLITVIRDTRVCIYFQLVIVIQLVQPAHNVKILVNVYARLDTSEPHVVLVTPTTMEVGHALVSHITLLNRLLRYLKV